MGEWVRDETWSEVVCDTCLSINIDEDDDGDDDDGDDDDGDDDVDDDGGDDDDGFADISKEICLHGGLYVEIPL